MNSGLQLAVIDVGLERWPDAANQPEDASEFGLDLGDLEEQYICTMTQTCKSRVSKDRGSLPQGRKLEDLLTPRLFKALCDPSRIAIISTLSTCCAPLTVSQVAESLPIDLSVVSRHLATLRDAGILLARKNGKEVHYSLSTRTLIQDLRSIADAFEACCPEEYPLLPGDPKEAAVSGSDG